MSSTCYPHSKYMCSEPACASKRRQDEEEEERARRRRQQEADDATMSAINTMNTIIAVEIATGII